MSWLRGRSGSARWRWLVAAAAVVVAAGAVGLALWPGAAALLNVTAARLTTQTFTDVVGTATLRPNADRDAGTDNDWDNQSGQRCNQSAVNCYTSLRDGSSATYITTGNNPNNRKAEFELDNAPSDVPGSGTPVVLVKVSFNAQKTGTGSRTISASVAVNRSDGTNVVTASDSNISSTGETVTAEASTSLSKAQVDGLHVVVTANTAGGGSGNNQLRVTDITVDITYLK